MFSLTKAKLQSKLYLLFFQALSKPWILLLDSKSFAIQIGIRFEEEVKGPSAFTINMNAPHSNLTEEFDREFKLLQELKSDSSKRTEFLSKLEDLTQRVDFQSDLSSHDSYINCWLEYAMIVKDQDRAIKFMLDHTIGVNDPKVHLNLAFFYEKYQRDFMKSEKVYSEALAIEGASELFKKIILKKYNEFSRRMQERINRDIISKVGEETFNQRIKSKKRKLNEAFPDLNESAFSDSSNSSKKRRLNQEMAQYHETLVMYEEGISYLKQSLPGFQELAVNEQSLKELETRPLSWITKHEMFNLTNELKEASESIQNPQFSIDDTQQKQIGDGPIGEKFEELKLEPLMSYEAQRKSREALMKAQQANVRANTLQTIGETSLDGHSNASALYNTSQITKQIVRLEESKQSIDESLMFRTANNSTDQIAPDVMMPPASFASNQNLEQDKISSILQQLTSLFAPHQSTQAQELVQQLIDLQKDQQKPLMSKPKENIPPLQAQSQGFNSQEFVQKPVNRYSNTSLIQQSPQKEISEKKRMSDIFMKVFEEGEKKRVSNVFQPSSSSPKPQPQPLTFSNFMKQLYQPQSKPQEAQRDSEVQSNNASYFEATPHESKFSKHINANYSQEFFMKKKTLSKGRPEMNQEPLAVEQEKFMSPFGLVSPMDNRTRARDSNIMKDCCGLDAFVPDHVINQPTFMNMMYQSIGMQPQIQYQSAQSQYSLPYKPTYSDAQSVFSNYTGKDQPKQSHGIVPTSAPQALKRESADSEGLVFQDCVNDFNALGQQQQQQRRQTDTAKLPSALKPNSTEEQSRNGSKSVRFVNH